MRTLSRNYLPDNLSINRKQYFYVVPAADNHRERKGMINFLSDRGYTPLQVDVLARNLKGKTDLHGNSYTPNGFIFTSPELSAQDKLDFMAWLDKPWVVVDISTLPNDGKEPSAKPSVIKSIEAIPTKKAKAQQFIEYRGNKYAVRSITYRSKDAEWDFIDSLVGTDQLNDIMYLETDHKDVAIASAAVEVDNQIAFFLPGEDIVNTSNEHVLKCLNDTFTEFVFTSCE